mgnify:CR=1 FL=1
METNMSHIRTFNEWHTDSDAVTVTLCQRPGTNYVDIVVTTHHNNDDDISVITDVKTITTVHGDNITLAVDGR